MINQIDHIEFAVKDVEEFVKLFEKLGFKVVARTKHHGGAAEMQLPGPNQPILEFHQCRLYDNVGLDHISFRTHNVKEEYEELQAKGITFEEGPRLIQVSGRTTVNFRNPDGFRLQLTDVNRLPPEI